MASQKITMDRWREKAPVYQDADTGLQTCLGPYVIAQEAGQWVLFEVDTPDGISGHPDIFSAYRAMVDAFEAWFKAAPRKRVYFIGEKAALGAYVKIGVAISLKSRLSNLQVGSPAPLQVLASVPGDENLERDYHLRFGQQRRLGEWFTINTKLLREIERLNEVQP